MKESRVRQTKRRAVCAASALVALAGCVAPGLAAEGDEGKALLASNCGRCHAVTAGEASPLKQAPNLFTVLGSYPGERLEFELAEGIGSRHRYMPQIQFSAEDITAIYYYLHGKEPESELGRPQ
jgi:mono/diheme cytochrome c family protein